MVPDGTPLPRHGRHPETTVACADADVVIDARNLTKRYGERLAVDDLTLSVYRGEVYGFLGLNGSGKTTTMRMLLGLISPTSGSACVLGRRPGTPSALRMIGSLIESPAFYPYLSGRDNLRVIARLAGVGMARVEESLSQVSLIDRAGDAFKAYSLSMKQRLGVAGALVKDPELLILDEPTNGLDPEGIADMGRLIESLRARGRTIFLSSHQLAGVEGLANRIGIMRQGRLVAEGTVAELRGKPRLLVRADPFDEARRVLEAAEPDRVVVQDASFIVQVDPERAPVLNGELISAGVAVTVIRPLERSLAEVFFDLNGMTREGEASDG